MLREFLLARTRMSASHARARSSFCHLVCCFVGYRHSYTHPDFADLTDAQLREELSNTQTKIAESICVRPRFVRPPYGSLPQAQQTLIESMGYKAATWSMSVGDWQYAQTDPDELLDRVANATGDFPNQVLHLQHDWYEESVAKVAQMIDIIKSAGYRFVTIDECAYGKQGRQVAERVQCAFELAARDTVSAVVIVMAGAVNHATTAYSNMERGCGKKEETCHVSSWSVWGACSSHCSTGNQTRTRVITGGTDRDCFHVALEESRRCICCHQAIVVSNTSLVVLENTTFGTSKTSFSVQPHCSISPGGSMFVNVTTFRPDYVAIHAPVAGVTFTAANWSDAVTFGVAAPDNLKNEGNRTFAVSVSARFVGSVSGSWSTTTDTVAVIVVDNDYDPNDPSFDSDPVAIAGSDQFLVVPADGSGTFNLTGNASYVLDADPMTFKWSLQHQPAGASAVLLSPTHADTAVGGTLPPGEYIFQLEVRDPVGHSSTTTTSVWGLAITSPPRLLDGCFIDTGCVIAVATASLPPAASVTMMVLLRERLASGNAVPTPRVLAYRAAGTVMPWQPDAASLPLDSDYTLHVTLSVTFRASAGADSNTAHPPLALAGEGQPFALRYSHDFERGAWSDCSATCGLGVRTRTLSCRNQQDDSLVPLDVCTAVLGQMSQPTTTRTCFLKPCTAVGWRVGGWSSCSQRCGPGVRTRTVECVDESASTVDDSVCTTQEPSAARPITSEACDLEACPHVTWFMTPWGDCTHQCGGQGMQYREALCVTASGSQPGVFEPAGRFVSTAMCSNLTLLAPGSTATPPQTSRGCNRRACDGFFFRPGPWSACNKACGSTGKRTRALECINGATGNVTSFASCDGAGVFRPAEEIKCNVRPCTSVAVVRSVWSPCQAQTCEPRQRNVSCSTVTLESVPLATCTSAGLPGTSVSASSMEQLQCDQPTCEDFCHNNTCFGHGACVTKADLPQGGECVCDPGFNGTYCDQTLSCVPPSVAMPDGTCCETSVTPTGVCCSLGFGVAADTGTCCPSALLDACGVCRGQAVAVDVHGVCCTGALDAAGVCCESGRVDECGVCDGVSTCARAAVVRIAPHASLSGTVDVSDVSQPQLVAYLQLVMQALEVGLGRSQRLIRVGVPRYSQALPSSSRRRALRQLKTRNLERPHGRGTAQQAQDASVDPFEVDIIVLADGDRPNDAKERMLSFPSWASLSSSMATLQSVSPGSAQGGTH